jgi:hypothetical protein
MTMPIDSRPLVPTQLVLGLATLVLGLVFLADSAGMLSADSGLALWPLGIVVAGIIVVLQPDTANRIVGTVLLIAGMWLVLNNIGVWTYSFWRTWPYLLIILGAGMVYRARGLRARDGLEHITGFAFLDTVARTAGARFTGGEFSAVAGDCDIDLRQATTGGENAVTVIDAFALFGCITLTVPTGWDVDNRVVPMFGRAAAPPASSGSGPSVVVHGSAIFGRVFVVTASS